jgi:hypothetical protein
VAVTLCAFFHEIKIILVVRHSGRMDAAEIGSSGCRRALKQIEVGRFPAAAAQATSHQSSANKLLSKTTSAAVAGDDSHYAR